ncbi:uncharacterized protein LOC107369231 [Tetranychus urticae]|uniref:Uncharacterized protein n=1 Tax=Tetranychus urticae TaxID=32264 RepID=T1L0R3_TETUR|nr:uncharacterized protein LOC107369231 [Tetranychus urticae]
MKLTQFSPFKVIILAYLQCLFSSSLPQLEEGKFLIQISDQYSAPLVVSFLHDRITINKQMLEKIGNSLTLDQQKKDYFDLSVQCLEILDSHLITLQKANYFDFNGTSKAKYFIELFNVYNEMYPVELGLNGMIFNDMSISTYDSLNKFLAIKSNDQLILETQKLTHSVKKDLDAKLRNETCNRLQRLACKLAISKLESLTNHFTVKPVELYEPYIYKSEPVYNSRADIAETLHKIKLMARLFHTLYSSLGRPGTSTNEPYIEFPSTTPLYYTSTNIPTNIPISIPRKNPTKNSTKMPTMPTMGSGFVPMYDDAY